MEQLYLLEVLIEKIRFAPSVLEVPQLHELKFEVVFAHLIHLDVSSNDIRGFELDRDPFKVNLNLDLGKSIIFASKPADLLSLICQSPLELHLRTPHTIGSVNIPWGINFIDLVKNSGANTNCVPALVINTFALLDNDHTKVADIKLGLRLSCNGQNIQTDFQIVPQTSILGSESTGNKYFLKDSKGGSLYRAQTKSLHVPIICKKNRFDENSNPDEIPLIAALYGPVDSKTFFQGEEQKPEQLSIDEITKILCNNKNCPGAKKFAEYGIGPAATGSGLGTFYEDSDTTDIPIPYGMSNTYGSDQPYGPFGLYVRPLSLHNENIEHLDEFNGKRKILRQSSSSKSQQPLRLKGGGTDSDENIRPQPMAMCKDLMQSFDKVLEAYKKALGPCGQGSCPFSYNILDESCKRFCQSHSTDNGILTPMEMSVANTPTIDPNIVSGCGTSSCPYSRAQAGPEDKCFQSKQIKSACGKPTCPFAKQRAGSATDEEMVEMQFMNGNTQPCAPRCPRSIPMPITKPLDPIHWDCPDPLPKGPCRNPQCPFKPKELRYIPKGPCGSTSCPYAMPPPCAEPTCPFAPPPQCPVPPNISGSSSGDSKCYIHPPPPCPVPACYPPPCGPVLPCCMNTSCPSNPPTCGDPNCPLNVPPRPCPAKMTCQALQPCPFPPCPFAAQHAPTKKPSPSSICSNPNCPYSTPKEDANKCFNPQCPHELDALDIESVCTNPNCPFQKSKHEPSICSNPACPFRKVPDNNSGSICSNPLCPFSKKSHDHGSICSNPLCPFKEKPVPDLKDSICSNPQCPFRIQSPLDDKESICTNPNCPFRIRLSKDSVCSNPDCPFQKKSPVGLKCSICSNPDCPFKAPTAKGAKSVCDNPECPYQEKASTEKDSICSNPNCPYAVKKREAGSICSNPECPLSNKKNSLPCDMEVTGAKVSLGSPTKKAPSGGQESYFTNNTTTTMQPTSEVPNNTTATDHRPNMPVKRHNGKQKYRTSKYTYKLGDLYPGVHIGHRECIIPGRNVPAKMGWAWNVHVPCVGLKPRRGWRPGAVGRKVAAMIMAHRRAKGFELAEPLTAKTKKSKSRFGGEGSESDVSVAPKATLQVKKRDGAYVITMNPLKDPKTIEDNENPYMDCSPLQFKITKNKDKSKESRMCFCDEADDEEESSSESELDIEFTPPAGIIHPDRLKKKKNIAHIDTQYNVSDFMPPKSAAKGGKGKGKGGKKDKKKKK